jgi:hypothetical protein
MRLFFILLFMFLHNAYYASANDTFTYQGQTLQHAMNIEESSDIFGLFDTDCNTAAEQIKLKLRNGQLIQEIENCMLNSETTDKFENIEQYLEWQLLEDGSTELFGLLNNDSYTLIDIVALFLNINLIYCDIEQETNALLECKRSDQLLTFPVDTIIQSYFLIFNEGSISAFKANETRLTGTKRPEHDSTQQSKRRKTSTPLSPDEIEEVIRRLTYNSRSKTPTAVTMTQRIEIYRLTLESPTDKTELYEYAQTHKLNITTVEHYALEARTAAGLIRKATAVPDEHTHAIKQLALNPESTKQNVVKYAADNKLNYSSCYQIYTKTKQYKRLSIKSKNPSTEEKQELIESIISKMTGKEIAKKHRREIYNFALFSDDYLSLLQQYAVDNELKYSTISYHACRIRSLANMQTKRSHVADEHRTFIQQLAEDPTNNGSHAMAYGRSYNIKEATAATIFNRARKKLIVTK